MRTVAELRDIVAAAKLEAMSDTAKLLCEALDGVLDLLPCKASVESNGTGDPTGWDWTRNNIELGASHGMSTAGVSTIRRLLKKPFVGRWDSVNTSEWDWKLPNAELARTYKVPIAEVMKLRRKRGAPPPCKLPTIGRHSTAQVYDVDWKAVQWGSKTDIEISNEIGCTRELVRQKRANLGKPKLRNHDRKYAEFLLFIDGRKKLSVEELSKCHVACANSLRRYCARAKVRVMIPKRRGRFKNTIPWDKMNWSLPSATIESVWGLCGNAAATHRSIHGIRSPEYRVNGEEVPPLYQQLVESEKLVAAAHYAAKEVVQTTEPSMVAKAA